LDGERAFKIVGRWKIKVDILKIKYSLDADIILIELRGGKPSDSVDLSEGVILHLDEDGFPLEIEILDASKVADTSRVSLENLRLEPVAGS
jgi:uncharacterized protein YuzE